MSTLKSREVLEKNIIIQLNLQVYSVFILLLIRKSESLTLN